MSSIDQKTLAYVNLYGILGALTVLCEQAPEAPRILGNSGCSIGFAVKDGPQATFTFVGGRCLLREGVEDCTMKIPFSSCERFNGMMEGTVKPIPSKGFGKLPFLLRRFKKLTDLLNAYLDPTEEQLTDPEFLRRSTVILFRVIAASAAAVANHDPVGRFSASNMPDGTLKLEIAGTCKAALTVQDHALTCSPKVPKDYSAYMQFADIETARALFDGKLNAVAAVGLGTVRIGGMIPLADNLNRLLSRAEPYLKTQKKTKKTGKKGNTEAEK